MWYQESISVLICTQKLKESDTVFLNPHAKIMTEREMNPGVSLPSSLI